MKLLKRQVVVSKNAGEVIQILKTCAYAVPQAVFGETDFSMYCPRRRNGGSLYLTHISGTVAQEDGSTTVLLEAHANPHFFLGLLLAIVGAVGLFSALVSHTGTWPPYLGMVLLGLLFIGHALWTGMELLNLIFYKLER